MRSVPAWHAHIGLSDKHGLTSRIFVGTARFNYWLVPGTSVEALTAAALLNDRGWLLHRNAGGLLTLGEGSLHAFEAVACAGVLHGALFDLGTLCAGTLRPFAPAIAGVGADTELSALANFERNGRISEVIVANFPASPGRRHLGQVNPVGAFFHLDVKG